jgi:hypothetical protein
MKVLCSFLFIVASTVLMAEVSVTDRIFIGGDAESKSRYMNQKYKFWGYRKYPEDKNFKGRMIILANSKITYCFWMPGKMKDGKWITALGMPGPSKNNWYGNGFFTIKSWKFDSSKAPAEIKDITKGEAGSFMICWKDNNYEAETKITLPDDADQLLVSTKLLKFPARVKSYTVSLLCYPGHSGGGWKQGIKIRKRSAMTPTREVNEEDKVQKLALDKKEMWCLFYDRYFDFEKNRGEGPCGFLYNPKETVKAQAIVTNYSCYVNLTYSTGKQSDIIIWDFNKMTNKQAADFLKSLNVTESQ